MRKRFTVGAFALLLLFAGCERAELAKDVTELAVVDSSTNKYRISRGEALSTLREMLRCVDGPGSRGVPNDRLAGISAESLRVVGGLKTRGDAPEDTLLYYLNLSSGSGYAILPADRRLGELPLVVTEQGSISADYFTEVDEDALPSVGGTVSPSENRNDSGYVVGNVDRDLGRDVARLVMRYANTMRGRNLGQWEGGATDEECEIYYSYGPWKWGQKVGPHLSTKWHQGEPFNDWCPIKSDGRDPNNRAPAGCVTIAVAQILAYHGWPAEREWWGVPVNWDTVRTVCNRRARWHAGSAEAQRQAAALAREVGVWLKVRYGANASGTTDFMARWYLKHLGYSRVYRHCGINESMVKQLLDAGRIVYISNSTHAWLLDGYVETKRTYTRTEICKSQRSENSFVERGHIRVHCNFGWRGLHDGYYFPGIFDTNAGPDLVDTVDKQSYQSRASKGREGDYSDNIHLITYW